MVLCLSGFPISVSPPLCNPPATPTWSTPTTAGLRSSKTVRLCSFSLLVHVWRNVVYRSVMCGMFNVKNTLKSHVTLQYLEILKRLRLQNVLCQTYYVNNCQTYTVSVYFELKFTYKLILMPWLNVFLIGYEYISEWPELTVLRPHRIGTEYNYSRTLWFSVEDKTENDIFILSKWCTIWNTASSGA